MILKYPFQINQYGKTEAVLDVETNVEQQIGEYLLSQQGQRPMSQLFGSNSYSLLFESFDPLVFEEFKMESLAELRTLIPSITIISIDVQEIEQGDISTGLPNSLGIRVTYQFPYTNMVKTTTYTINNPLQLTEDAPL
jgi:phage baseplate assembly protein W